MKQKIYRSLFWLGYMMVFVIAFIPLKKDLHEISFNIVTFKFHFDQALHVVVYFLICLYFLTGQFLGLTLFKGNSINKFLVVILILAISTELIQLMVPYRSFNFFDLIANVVGVGVGMGIYWGIGRKK